MELTTSSEKILKAAETCPDAEEILKILFPDAFKEKWEDITEEVTGKFQRHIQGCILIFVHEDENIYFSGWSEKPCGREIQKIRKINELFEMVRYTGKKYLYKIVKIDPQDYKIYRRKK